MFWRNALKYPALIVGGIMFTLFIMDPKTKVWWNKIQGRYIPSTCRAIADRVEQKAPSEWTIECPSTSRLLLTVDSSHSAKNFQELRTNIYRSLANTLKDFSLKANPETMANLGSMEILIKHPKIEVWGATDGQAMVELRKKETKQEMAKHLELTVKVKEKRI